MKQALDLVTRALPAAHALIITSMPRGSLQIAQPPRLPEALLRGYQRQHHLEDRLTWQAILTGHVVDSAEVLGDAHPFVRDYLQPVGLSHAAAAPLKSPVIEGYAGAVHLYRSPDQAPFDAAELRKLKEIAGEIDELIAKARSSRAAGDEEPKITLTPRPAARQFAFDEKGQQLLSKGEFARLDSRLRDEMAEQAKARLNRLNGQLVVADRAMLPDSRGDLWAFRAVTYASYPAMAKHPIVLFSMQPTCAEWAAVRPADLQADAELARLLPALKFMREEFHRGPTLGEIARQVHLSPFHFHRRFAELLGLTPKHYLLDCQITRAKVELLAEKKELAQIAADCGFAHQSHFTSRFKQATGLTPTRWRRLAREHIA